MPIASIQIAPSLPTSDSYRFVLAIPITSELRFLSLSRNRLDVRSHCGSNVLTESRAWIRLPLCRPTKPSNPAVPHGRPPRSGMDSLEALAVLEGHQWETRDTVTCATVRSPASGPCSSSLGSAPQSQQTLQSAPLATVTLEAEPAVGEHLGLGEDLDYMLNDDRDDPRQQHLGLGEDLGFMLDDDRDDPRRCRSRSPVRRVILPLAEGSRHGSVRSRKSSRPVSGFIPQAPLTNLLHSPSSLCGAGFWRALVGADRSQVSLVGGRRCLITDDVRLGTARVNRACEHFIRSGCSIYVGISQDPDRRWSHHSRSSGWVEMHVVVQASNSSITSAIEVAALARWLGHPACRNASRGGESMTAGEPHYVYVLEGCGVVRSR